MTKDGKDKGYRQASRNTLTKILTAGISLVRLRKDRASASSMSHPGPQSASKQTSLTTHRPDPESHLPLPQASKMMDDSDQQRHALRQAIEGGSFWTIPDLELLRMIRREFPKELERLRNATFLRDPNAPRPKGLSISESLYGQDYAEVNRTLVGVLALRWLWNNQYETFVGSQSPAPVVLKHESFDWLRSLFSGKLRSPEDIYTLITSMVINDLGKDPDLATDYARLKGIDISKVNHDMILYHAAGAGLVPALNRLTKQNRDVLLAGMKLGSDFNFGQLAQAENAPASLAGLLQMHGHDWAFEMRFMEQVLDLAGAAGHEDWTYAKKMIEPIFQSYRNVYDVAHAIIGGKTGLRAGYDIILMRKLELLHKTGYPRQFDIRVPADRATLRLFCLGNTIHEQNADMYFVAFTQSVSEEIRHTLIHGLNVDGSVDEPAVQPTYMPAMLTKAVGNTSNGTHEEKTQAIVALLRYLARCLVVDRTSLEKLPRGVTVIERDVRKISPVLDSKTFKENPDVLDGEDIPEDQVANLAPEYGFRLEVQ
ncbi:hypothetical protein A1O3_09864 [Capronia epimyces CBS 606.96]|uniref:Uncharacterized protein n=1 Tax=Capronia epimyces CBS 606.96 TaxID=1182542 RepID=W9XKY0_9EURO|nr:uncharacterized protein A1O3_09864 [Capronia epimyces CBS 606.96]EXJ77636.1 hypothetical protein A1O3_09864 [Capronia epimyces CBS 606.96]